MISVCIACYNGQKYIKQQIDSILCQLEETDELIISDDGSNDDTLKIIRGYNDCRIKIHNNHNHGVNNNFENALSFASGEYVFLCDQDDIWMPNKVKIILDALQKYVMVVHNAKLIDGEGRPIGKTYYDCTHDKVGFWANFYKSRYLGCCMAFRSSLLKEIMPFPKNIFGHDYWIGLYGDCKYRVHFINDILICYRRHDNNVSTSSEKSKDSFYTMLVKKRLSTLYKILIRRFHVFLNAK